MLACTDGVNTFWFFLREMKVQKKERLAALRSMLLSMEREVGLDELSEGQRDVYYAACLAASGEQLVYQRRHSSTSYAGEDTKKYVFQIPKGISRYRLFGSFW